MEMNAQSVRAGEVKARPHVASHIKEAFEDISWVLKNYQRSWGGNRHGGAINPLLDDAVFPLPVGWGRRMQR